jgi:hypothetical protein
MLLSAVAAHMAPAASLRLPLFTMAAGSEHGNTTRPGFATQLLNPAARKPAAAAPTLVVPYPIPTVAVTPPAHAAQRLESGLPHPGLVSIEFHANRLRSVPLGQPVWNSPHPTLHSPQFLLQAVLDKPEDLVQQPQPKPARKEPGVVIALPNMPATKRPPNVLMVAGRIAAGFLLAVSLGLGVAKFSLYHRVSFRDESVPSGPALSVAAGGSAASGPGAGAAQPAQKGAIAWVRQAVAQRAALRIADDFHGMGSWDGALKAPPAGWTRHAEGYMSTGALALFRPSLNFKDYKLEFFGQIESQSIGWTVRAADTSNYHAMKLSIVEAGMRPFVALVHYSVVGGRAQRPTRTLLSVMVHNNTPMQFAVDVRGKHVVTSIDGEEVDSYIDNTSAAGGVGFFSDKGERARLYWMRVSRNDDWLGHVCAMLIGGTAADSTAAICAPRVPGGAPAPGLPAGGDETTVAAAWLALPSLGVNRKARFLKTWRS